MNRSIAVRAAYTEGMKDNLLGKNLRDNPYCTEEMSEAWRDGFIDSRKYKIAARLRSAIRKRYLMKLWRFITFR